MSKPMDQIPQFKSESAEADWWASPAGRAFAERRAAENMAAGTKIAIRLPGSDLAQARDIAERKGIGYQTLIKMIIHEGLAREREAHASSGPVRARKAKRKPA